MAAMCCLHDRLGAVLLLCDRLSRWICSEEEVAACSLRQSTKALVYTLAACPVSQPCNLLQGNRDNIDSMAGGSQKILNQVLKLIDQHDLYGSVAYPKKHQQKDISDIYLLPFATRGIFTNVALQEPFGLTVIEVGLPCASEHALLSLLRMVECLDSCLPQCG